MFWRLSLRTKKQRESWQLALNEWNANVDSLLKATKERDSARAKYTEALSSWQRSKHDWDSASEKFRSEFAAKVGAWHDAKRAFDAATQVDQNTLARLKSGYEARAPQAIADAVRYVLLESAYPAACPRSVTTTYDPDSKILLIEMALPNLRDAQIFESSETTSNPKPVSAASRRKIANATYCAILIRSMYEAVQSDRDAVIEGIAANGQMTFIDRAVGHTKTETIASVFASREAISGLNLANIDPIACFRSLKGLYAAGAEDYTPVPPVMIIDRTDQRIVPAKDVLGGLTDQTNLAAMEWEDFEHLVRQLFEKEFSGSAGAEVKVTRASRDYGVDAIVFDPDPVRGGKFVIQAKRYTIPVDVAAVRDLYGTIVNEGAVKGLLVTTSHFGSESYDFAKGKPITLIDGANLLSLFKRHGYHFNIDITGARQGRS